jgi:hypothetical protein
MKTTLAATTILLLSACGGGNSANGTVEGATLTVQDALSFHQTFPSLVDGGSVFAAGFALTDIANTCSAIGSHRNPPSATVLSVEVVDVQPITATGYTIRPLSAGIGTPPWGIGVFAKSDATCHSTVGDTALSGTVTFSSVSSGQASGTYDLTFPDAGHISGSFSAPDCAAFDTLLQGGSDAGAATCG